MATLEHCLYCFEVLAANLENREALSLAEVQKSWSTYVTTLDDDDEANPRGKLTKRLPALRRLVGSSSSSAASSAQSSSASSTTSLPQPASGADTPATSVSSVATPPPVVAASPLFVTWNVISTRHDPMLRGCIGTFEDEELSEGLASYSLTSALHDTRFRPISLRELPTLEVAVTLLTDFEDADGPMDWELGVHGLRISFHYHGRRYGATYLPDVAVEQGWTKEETLVSLMRKAGWMGRKDKWEEVELKVVRYQGKKESLEHTEFKRWRDWVDKGGK
ncbi:hypothetical protein OQA88_8488 [Cercophora sp. LCS_1]